MSLPTTSEVRPTLHLFMGVEIAVPGAVLVPRRETELLGREAVRLLRAGGGKDPLVIDMCCGSGNLALALAEALPSARLFAADVTDDAVQAAEANAERLGLSRRVAVRQGDLFEALSQDGIEGQAAMIVCNPPYISSTRLDGESAHLLRSEPREAFDGGPYGISLQQRLVREAPRFLKPGGLLLFEFGDGQERQARALLQRARAYSLLAFPCDAAGRPRVAAARCGKPGA